MTDLLIMAGGLGTRFGNISTHTHKSLLPIDGRPILEHLIKSFPKGTDVKMAVNKKYFEQMMNFTDRLSINSWPLKVNTNSPIETYLKLSKDRNNKPFFLSVSDGFPAAKIKEPKTNVFYTKCVERPEMYNVPDIFNLGFDCSCRQIIKFNHFGSNITTNKNNTGLTGLFYIKDVELWNKICRESQHLEDRARNNWVFDKFVEATYVEEVIIDWNEFNSIEDYLNYAKN